MRNRLLTLALASMFLVAAIDFAAAKSVDIKKITKSADFTKRQSPRLQLKPIEIKPLDLTGGQNVDAAIKAVDEAIKTVEKEIKDQEELLKSYKQRIMVLRRQIAALKTDRADLVAQRDQIEAELAVLRGIPNPSQPVTECIDELVADLAQANAQIANIDKAIETYEERITFIEKVGMAAKNNLEKLQAALANLKEARADLGKIVRPNIKPEWLKRIDLKAERAPKHPGRVK